MSYRLLVTDCSERISKLSCAAGVSQVVPYLNGFRFYCSLTVVFLLTRRRTTAFTAYQPMPRTSPRRAVVMMAGSFTSRAAGGHTTSCNKCGSLPAIGPGSGAQQAEQSPPPGSTTATRPPSGRGMTKLAHPPPLSSDAGGGRDGTKTSLGPVAEKQVLSTSEGCEQSLARACAAFGNGMKAYMREDPEVGIEG